MFLFYYTTCLTIPPLTFSVRTLPCRLFARTDRSRLVGDPQRIFAAFSKCARSSWCLFPSLVQVLRTPVSLACWALVSVLLHYPVERLSLVSYFDVRIVPVLGLRCHLLTPSQSTLLSPLYNPCIFPPMSPPLLPPALRVIDYALAGLLTFVSTPRPSGPFCVLKNSFAFFTTCSSPPTLLFQFFPPLLSLLSYDCFYLGVHLGYFALVCRFFSS